MIGKAMTGIVHFLIRKGIVQSEKALFWACRRGAYETVLRLTEGGVDINARDAKGLTALHHTCIRGRSDIAQILLEKGADVDAKLQGGYTPLWYAITFRHIDLVRLLTESHAAVDSRTGDSIPLLSDAGLRGCPEIISMLLARGANPNVKQADGSSPLHAAVIGANPASRTEFTDGGAVMDHRHVECARLLINSGADVNAIGGKGLSPLHVAALVGNLPMAQLLIEMKADTSLRHPQLGTAAQIAAEGNDKSLVRLLSTTIDSRKP